MRSRFRLLIPLLLIVLGMWAVVRFGGTAILTAAAGPMIEEWGGDRADVILVLAGDIRGDRLLTACQLLAKGAAPRMLVTGPMEWYGVNEADLALNFAKRNGCDTARVEAVYIRALSTVDEANATAQRLKASGTRHLLLVTSNFHSARAARIFRRLLGPDIRVSVYPAPDRYFSRDGWWKNREGQKTWFFEFSKIIADGLGW